MSRSQWLLLIFLSTLWGASFFFVGVAVKEVPPLTLVAARVVLAAVALGPVLLLAGLALPRTWAAWAPFAVMAILNNAIPFTLITTGQREVASGLASVLNATTPLWTVVLAHLLTDDRLKANRLAGVVLGIAGVGILVGPEAMLGRSSSLFGMLLLLGATMSYGLSGIWGRRFKVTPPLVTAQCQLICSSALMLPLALLVDGPWRMAPPSGTAILAIVGLATLSTALAYIVFFRIMAVSGPTNTSLVTLLVPVSAILLGTFALGEALLARHIAGALVIGLSLLVIDGRVTSALLRVAAARR